MNINIKQQSLKNMYGRMWYYDLSNIFKKVNVNKLRRNIMQCYIIEDKMFLENQKLYVQTSLSRSKYYTFNRFEYANPTDGKP